MACGGAGATIGNAGNRVSRPDVSEADAYLLAPFRKGLSEAGFDEGRNVSIDYRFAERDVSRLPALAAELVRRKVTAVFTGTTVSALALRAATATIPIVFLIGADPVNTGLVASLNRPGGNLTGVSFFTNQMEPKRLGLLHELVPKFDLIAVLLNPNNPFFDNQLRELGEALAHSVSKSTLNVPAARRISPQPSRPSRDSRPGRCLSVPTRISTASALWSSLRLHNSGFPPSTNGGNLQKQAV